MAARQPSPPSAPGPAPQLQQGYGQPGPQGQVAAQTEAVAEAGWLDRGLNTIKDWVGLDGEGAAPARTRAAEPRPLPGLEDLQPGPSHAPAPQQTPANPPAAQTWAAPAASFAPDNPGQPSPPMVDRPVLEPEPQPQPLASQTPVTGAQGGGFAPWTTLKRWMGLEPATQPLTRSDSPAPVVEGAAPQEPVRAPAKAQTRTPPQSRPKSQAPSQSRPQARPQVRPRPTPVEFKPLPGDERKIHVVQIQSASQRAGLEALSAQLGLGAKAWIHEEQRNGAPWFSLFYGRYGTLNQALDAMQALPRAVQQRGPWVRKLELAP
ncbi:SPOR domain-containing protein [Magnetovirga frankeli]|uniref:SPOR domain-containing protein n=1 Tax=Magnetovirga frankeli TaxID=947516 RepID=UPI001AF64E53|nr:SPOR domain-containing protein [gamma proteobacterium SS-5]